MAGNVKRLRLLLRLNAAFSMVNAVLMIVLATPLGSLMGLAGKWLVAFVALFVALFAAGQWYYSRFLPHPRPD